MRHHGFLAVALAGAVAVTGWILSRSEIVDASEDATTSFREAYAHAEPDAEDEDPQGLRLNYFNARWSSVLQDLADHAELTLVMDKVPPGRFARRDRTRYATKDCIRILNRELESVNFRLLQQGQFLIVLHLDQARTRYARPVLSSDTGPQRSREPANAVRTVAARIDQPNVQWASGTDESADESEPQATRRAAEPTTIPLQGVAAADQRASDDRRRSSAKENEESGPAVLRNVEIEHATAAEVARAIYLVFERRAELVPKGLQGQPTFVVYDAADTEKKNDPLFQIGINQQENSLIVEARAKRADQLVKLLKRLDKPAADDNTSTRLVPSESISEETAAGLNDRLRQLVAMRQQQQQQTDSAPAANDPTTPDVTDTTAFNLRGDVNVQAMQGTGVLLIEGNDEDLERLAPIIRRLEELSVGSLPDVHLLELEHVNSESFSELLTQVYNKLAELRQRGDTAQPSVAFFPVVQPNSVLILAPQLEMPAIQELAQQLDTEVEPDSEFRVFELKHAIASQVLSTLDQFYEETPGLATRIRAVADVRTNSVIVQGHPRDLTEVARLIKDLDRDEPGAVHLVRVIELSHATASELSEVLSSAIQSVTSPPRTSGTGFGGGGGGGNQGPQELRDTKSIALEFLTTDGNAQRLIRSGFLVDVRINPDPRSNSLIISAPEASMSLLEALVRSLDQAPSATAAIKVFALSNADAEQSVELLTTMFENTNQEEQLGVQISGAEDAASSLIPLQFSADIRTNTVLAVGSEEALSVVEAILLRLDSDDTRQQTTAVIQLRNAQATRVAASVNLFLEDQQALRDSTDDLISNIERVRQEAIVAPDFNSNSLIVSASPEYFSKITEIINELDATPPQVIIQALMVEVTLDNTDEFGVELGFQDPLLYQRSIVQTAEDLITIPTTTAVPGVGTVESTTIVSQSSTPGFNFNNTLDALGNNFITGDAGALGSQGISNFSLGRQNGDLGFGGFVFSAQSDAVNVLIRALAARRTLHVLSRPQIRTTQNNEAIIRVGQEVPVVDGVVIDEGIVSPEIVQRDTGIILQVTPRITPDGTVAMEVYAEKSALSGGRVPVFTDISTGNTIESTIRDVAIAETVVNVPNGQTIVIGGIITTSDETAERKVPWLGDLPVVGKAFRYDATSTRRGELLIFLTPRIIYGDADSELIKQVEAERIHFVESEAEEVHGPIYSVPPSARQPMNHFIPSADPLQHHAPVLEPTPEPLRQSNRHRPQPGEFHSDASGSRQARTRDVAEQSQSRRTEQPPQQPSSAVQAARNDGNRPSRRRSWAGRLLKRRSEPTQTTPVSSAETTDGPTVPAQPEFDFDDSQWN